MRSSALSPGSCMLSISASHSLPFTPFIYQRGTASKSFKTHAQLLPKTREHLEHLPWGIHFPACPKQLPEEGTTSDSKYSSRAKLILPTAIYMHTKEIKSYSFLFQLVRRRRTGLALWSLLQNFIQYHVKIKRLSMYFFWPQMNGLILISVKHLQLLYKWRLSPTIDT